MLNNLLSAANEPRTFKNDRLNNDEAAAYLGVQPQTLQVWRSTRRYPISHVKVGRKVYYRRADLDAFIESRTIDHAESGERGAQ